jgi:hypothetical protein
MSNCGAPEVFCALPDSPDDELAAPVNGGPRAWKVGYPCGKADVNWFDMLKYSCGARNE